MQRRAIANAIIEELQRQGEQTGSAVETNGTHVQVDGSFALGPLVEAVIQAINNGTVPRQ